MASLNPAALSWAPSASAAPAQPVGIENRAPAVNSNNNSNSNNSDNDTTRGDASATPPTRSTRKRNRNRGRHAGAPAQTDADAPTQTDADAPAGRRSGGRGGPPSRNEETESRHRQNGIHGHQPHEANGGRRGRGRAGPFLAPPRTFGSQLTGTSRRRRNRHRDDDAASVADSDGGASVVPEHPPSTAADLTTRMHEDIDRGHYDCVICLNAVTRTSRVWSCRMCFHVAHAACVAAWVRQAQGEGVPMQRVRCPACNSAPPETVDATAFFGKQMCWCGKQRTAGVAPAALPPHSCGRICGRRRAAEGTTTTTCEHACPSVCHAGPCAPCTEMGPLQTCFGGHETVARPCALGGSSAAWSCGAVCNELLACGQHRCKEPCHAGACPPCPMPATSTCFCGKDTRSMLCRDLAPAQTTWSAKTQTTVQGTHDCGAVCGRAFDCGVHVCQKRCHAQDAEATHCPASVDVVGHCRCGKTPLALVGHGRARARTSCTDPVPSCKEVCGRVLPGCDHRCTAVCHDATQPCPPCPEAIVDKCACGATTHATVCGAREARAALACDTVCRAWLSCKQHRCTETCCAGRPKSLQRLALTKKKARATAEAEMEAEHTCLRTCGRLLRCGRHTCPQVCHKGACYSCVAYVHEALACACGRTRVEPPFLCGTALPRCDYDCPRPLACGHAAVPHRCHDLDDRPCPRCQVLVRKTCLCGRLALDRVACGADRIECGAVCNEMLACGVHRCRRTCHAAGACEPAGAVCVQTCGRRKTCGHPCTASCHGPETPCSETVACGSAVEVRCACGRLGKRVRCNASAATEPDPDRRLACDDECLRVQRNAALRSALRLSDGYRDEHQAYPAPVMEFFFAHRAQCTSIESALRALAAAAADAAHVPGTKQTHKFAPMKRAERQFVHALCAVLGLRSEAFDLEPHRYVVASTNSTSSTSTAAPTVPPLTLAESEEIYVRLQERAAETAALAASEAIKADTARQLQARRDQKTEREQTVPPLNCIFVPAAAAPLGPPLAPDAWGAILDAWQQSDPARASDTAVLVDHRLQSGDYLVRLDTDAPGTRDHLLAFTLGFLVDPAALASHTPYLCHADDAWRVLRRATASPGDTVDSPFLWNVVAGRERAPTSSATPTSTGTGWSTPSPSPAADTPARRLFTLRKKVVTTALGPPSTNPRPKTGTAALSEAERRRRMAILAAQPTDESVSESVESVSQSELDERENPTTADASVQEPADAPSAVPTPAPVGVAE